MERQAAKLQILSFWSDLGHRVTPSEFLIGGGRANARITWRRNARRDGRPCDRHSSQPPSSLKSRNPHESLRLSTAISNTLDRKSRGIEVHNPNTPKLSKTTTHFHICTTETNSTHPSIPNSRHRHVRDTTPLLAIHPLPPNRPLLASPSVSAGPAQSQHRHSPMDDGVRVARGSTPETHELG